MVRSKYSSWSNSLGPSDQYFVRAQVVYIRTLRCHGSVVDGPRLPLLPVAIVIIPPVKHAGQCTFRRWCEK